MEREKWQEQAEVYRKYANELRGRLDILGNLRELTPYKQFIVWKAEYVDGKLKKPPYNPRTHRLASPTDPKTWGTVHEALTALSTGRYNGIGFTFTQDDPFVGIDLDRCAFNNGQIDYTQAKFIRQMDTYTEYSPRDGVHLLVKARLPITTIKRGDLEIFSHGHTMSLTWRHVPGTPLTIEERQDELDALTQSLMHPSAPDRPAPALDWQTGTQQITRVEENLVQHWKEESVGFRRYFEGDRRLWQEGRGRRVRSKSEADFVLCLMLLSRTHDDVEETKRLFHASELFDPAKTDRISGHDPRTGRPVTYLEMTIFNALRKRNEPRVIFSN